MPTAKRFTSVILLAVLILVPGAALAATEPAQMPNPTMDKPATNAAEKDLRLAMRNLWEDHIAYTRNYIVSSLGPLSDADAIAGRLLRNQDEIGSAIAPYYGEAAGKQLAMLLRDHIKIATEVVTAAKTNDNQALDRAQKNWSANAAAIADFLSGANPAWNKAELTDMLQKHLDLTTGEIVARLKKDWEADIDAYDKGQAHMLAFADILTNGIVAQFPNKFGR